MRNLPIKKIVTGLVFSSALIGTSLFAGNINEVKVVLANTLSAPKLNVIAGDGVFNCDGNTCTASMERQKPMSRDCRPLARQVGKVVSFQVGSVALDEKGLETCNKGIN